MGSLTSGKFLSLFLLIMNLGTYSMTEREERYPAGSEEHI